MKKNSFAEIINFSKLMVSGMRANSEALADRGITTEFIDSVETSTNLANSLDSEQESLKAQLKVKTSALNDELAGLGKQLAEAKTIIKLVIDKAAWPEFGISDKR